MSDANEKFYKTHDLSISALLVASECLLDSIERQGDGRALFVFKNSLKIKQIISEYWQQRLLINPRKLFEALKFVKNRLYSDF